ncbi:hypothetical protein HQ545_00045 [Candidatus Woesearchaeota archaeon]|nr:hypothetical protein [Candidatus Woesearchaeota archaeon]
MGALQETHSPQELARPKLGDISTRPHFHVSFKESILLDYVAVVFAKQYAAHTGLETFHQWDTGRPILGGGLERHTVYNIGRVVDGKKVTDFMVEEVKSFREFVVTGIEDNYAKRDLEEITGRTMDFYNFLHQQRF